jgi:hypothetical protein
MENIILKTIDFEPARVTTEFIDSNDEDKGVILKFGEKEIKLESYHDQDCCEHVYADFGIIKHYLKQLITDYKQLVIKKVPEMGILLHFVASYSNDEKIFIPCYNEQNGYYSDKLSLIITINPSMGPETIKLDITDCKQDKEN